MMPDPCDRCVQAVHFLPKLCHTAYRGVLLSLFCWSRTCGCSRSSRRKSRHHKFPCNQLPASPCHCCLSGMVKA